jgi:hypothetical protein
VKQNAESHGEVALMAQADADRTAAQAPEGVKGCMGQLYGRLAAAGAEHCQVSPANAGLADSGTERLGYGLLGGKTRSQ